MSRCDKAIKESKSAVNTLSGRAVASGMKEGEAVEEGESGSFTGIVCLLTLRSGSGLLCPV